jgi:hypothetical protein
VSKNSTTRIKLGLAPDPKPTMAYVIGWLEDIFGKGKVNAAVENHGYERVVWVRCGARNRFEGRGATWREAASACIDDIERSRTP